MMSENEQIMSKIVEVQSKLEENMKKAESIAKKIGLKEKIIGWVSPYEATQVSDKGKLLKIIVELDDYLNEYDKKLIARSEAILATVDLITLEIISLRVVVASRVDYYSSYGESEALTPYPIVHDVRGLMTRPQVTAEPLLAFKYREVEDGVELYEGKVANYVIEPRSPVVIPKPEYLEKLLGIKGDVVLGAYTIGEEPLLFGGNVARVLIPFEDLLYHTFIVGTTGSGKTTFVKNLIKSLFNVKDKNIAIVCIDDNGDYIQTIFDPIWEIGEEVRIEEELAKQLYGGIGGVKKVNVLLPVTKHFILRNSITDLKELIEKYYENYLRKMHAQANNCSLEELQDKYSIETEKKIAVLKIKTKNGEERVINIIPYALNFDKIEEKISDLYPYFTARAREAFPHFINAFISDEGIAKLTNAIKQRTKMSINLNVAKDFDELLNDLDTIEEVIPSRQLYFFLSDYFKIHEQTLRNMISGLKNLGDMGIFDVNIGNTINEPNVEAFIEKDSLTILDLRILTTKAAKRILTLRLLNNLLEWKMKNEFQKTPSIIVLVDEAHKFFPRSAEPGEEEYVEYVCSALERLARLGRVRGLGLILSTHSPKDVHSTVLNLCNNKVIFRLEPSLAEELELPKELRDFVSKASDRVGVITSHALRLHYATFKTTPPALGHFKVRG